MRELIKKHPIIAIFRHLSLEQTIPFAEAIYAGGIHAFEIAFNSQYAAKQIRLLRDHFGDRALIGAGTTITVERAKEAVDAGAQFLLTPSANPDVLAYAAKYKIKLLPGVMTPTDVDLCWQHGFKTLKLFPAASLPANYVKDLKGPFDDTEYVAVGGVTPDNLVDFKSQGFVGVGIGSSLVPNQLLEPFNKEAIRSHIQNITKNSPWK